MTARVPSHEFAPIVVDDRTQRRVSVTHRGSSPSESGAVGDGRCLERAGSVTAKSSAVPKLRVVVVGPNVICRHAAQPPGAADVLFQPSAESRKLLPVVLKSPIRDFA